MNSENAAARPQAASSRTPSTRMGSSILRAVASPAVWPAANEDPSNTEADRTRMAFGIGIIGAWKRSKRLRSYPRSSDYMGNELEVQRSDWHDSWRILS